MFPSTLGLWGTVRINVFTNRFAAASVFGVQTVAYCSKNYVENSSRISDFRLAGQVELDGHNTTGGTA